MLGGADLKNHTFLCIGAHSRVSVSGGGTAGAVDGTAVVWQLTSDDAHC